MISLSKHKNPSGRLAFILVAALLFSGSAFAQEYDSLIARYKKEDAVVINYDEHLIITIEDGELVAKSYVTKEKLFISDLSRGIYNLDGLICSDFHDLTDIKTWSWIPDKKEGYRKVYCGTYAEVNPNGESVFYDDLREIVVAYSGLLKNSVTHTYYALEHTDPHMLQPFTFQENIPVDKATFEVTVPKTVNIAFALKGLDTARIKRTVTEKGNKITYKFEIKDVPAFKEFDHVPTALYYADLIIPYITSYKLSESNKKVDMLADADQLYKYLYKYIRNHDLRKDTLLDKTVAEITRKDTDPREKAKHIYDWVQKNIHYIAFEKGLEGFEPRQADSVMKRKYGDCKDMTSLLVNMFRRAGLDAHYTWIGTRHLPFKLDETPLPLASNHMICALKMGDEWIFVDGTHPFIPFGQAPSGIQGKEAMIAIDEKNYKIVNVPISSSDKNVVVDSTLISFNGSKLSGKVKQYYKGDEAWYIGYLRMYLKGDDWDKRVRELTIRGTDKYQHDKHVTSTGLTQDKDASIETDFNLDDYVSKIGKDYYINMNLKHTFEDNRIDTENRRVSYYYDYKQTEKEVVVLDVPKGFKVTHLPPSAHGSVDGLWSYDITYKAEKDRIVLVKEYTLNTLDVSPKLFASNNKLVDDLKNQYKETVVLTAKK